MKYYCIMVLLGKTKRLAQNPCEKPDSPSCCTPFLQRPPGHPSSTWSGAQGCPSRSSSGAQWCPQAHVCSSVWLWSLGPPGTCSDQWEPPLRGLLPRGVRVASLCHAHLGERRRRIWFSCICSDHLLTCLPVLVFMSIYLAILFPQSPAN